MEFLDAPFFILTMIQWSLWNSSSSPQMSMKHALTRNWTCRWLTRSNRCKRRHHWAMQHPFINKAFLHLRLLSAIHIRAGRKSPYLQTANLKDSIIAARIWIAVHVCTTWRRSSILQIIMKSERKAQRKLLLVCGSKHSLCNLFVSISPLSTWRKSHTQILNS